MARACLHWWVLSDPLPCMLFEAPACPCFLPCAAHPADGYAASGTTCAASTADCTTGGEDPEGQVPTCAHPVLQPPQGLGGLHAQAEPKGTRYLPQASSQHGSFAARVLTQPFCGLSLPPYLPHACPPRSAPLWMPSCASPMSRATWSGRCRQYNLAVQTGSARPAVWDVKTCGFMACMDPRGARHTLS